MTASDAALNALIVGDAEGPLLTLHPYTPADKEKGAPIALSQSQIAALSALLQHVPGVAAGTTQALSQTYVLRFAPPVAQQLTSGSATLMKSLEGGLRATAVDARGTIIGQGTLVAATGLNVAGVALAAWQILALITAQHYLADITARLSALEAGVAFVRQRLEDADVATLVADYKQLKLIYTMIMSGQLSEPEFTNVLVQVDSIDRTASRIAETFALSMARQASALEVISMTGWFDPQAEIDDAKAGTGNSCYARWRKRDGVWRLRVSRSRRRSMTRGRDFNGRLPQQISRSACSSPSILMGRSRVSSSSRRLDEHRHRRPATVPESGCHRSATPRLRKTPEWRRGQGQTPCTSSMRI